jgi:bifunctional DNase/RNase
MHQKEKIVLEIAAKIASVNGPKNFNRPLAHDVTAPVTMHLEDKLAIYA